jgi:hypothetical protein
MVIAMVALFISLGGSAVAVTSGADPGRGKLTLRIGKLVDKDTTPSTALSSSRKATRSARRANG